MTSLVSEPSIQRETSISWTMEWVTATVRVNQSGADWLRWKLCKITAGPMRQFVEGWVDAKAQSGSVGAGAWNGNVTTAIAGQIVAAWPAAVGCPDISHATRAL